MKIITMYLPQFHTIRENDEWWEEGYTEWTAVRRASKQYEGHNQPRVPLNKNYYNLLEHDVMLNQATLMKQYGIDAQCFYHYWFKDGRRILEKPAENLLRWTDINMPFCFCWANQSWARSWSAIRDKNSWNDNYKDRASISGDGVLLEQNYGTEQEWKKHFDYLLPFFRDNRYMKIENKPVFLFYKSEQIPCLHEMLLLWKKLAIANGFDGMYMIGAYADDANGRTLDKILRMEPQEITALFRHSRDIHSGTLAVHDYNELWNQLLNYVDKRKNVLYSGFVGYDDTPRRGNDGEVIENQSPESFRVNLSRLLAKNFVKGNDLIFLNAWNEWGEGMYLEPDEKDGYSYLESVLYAKEHFTEYIQEFEQLEEVGNNFQLEILQKDNERYKSYWTVLDAWLCLKEKNIRFESYFINKKIKTIAIYGMGLMGRHLLSELAGSNITVAYGIDQQGQILSRDLRIYKPDEELSNVDAVVVAVTFSYGDIVHALEKKGFSNIIILRNILNELGKNLF